MPRPCKHRKVSVDPACCYFKPKGVPMFNLEEAILEHDELEALRLADFLALSHEAGAVKMKISRATFGRIIEKARYKIADCILNGKAIRINETYPENIINKIKKDKCSRCGNQRSINSPSPKTDCPKCKKLTGGSK